MSVCAWDESMSVDGVSAVYSADCDWSDVSAAMGVIVWSAISGLVLWSVESIDGSVVESEASVMMSLVLSVIAAWLGSVVCSVVSDDHSSWLAVCSTGDWWAASALLNLSWVSLRMLSFGSCGWFAIAVVSVVGRSVVCSCGRVLGFLGSAVGFGSEWVVDEAYVVVVYRLKVCMSIGFVVMAVVACVSIEVLVSSYAVVYGIYVGDNLSPL